jgi:hypothetical protein
VIDIQKIATPSLDGIEVYVHPAVIHIVGINLTVKIECALGANLANQRLTVLIGRDFLTHCTLFYSGTTGTISLAQ